MQLRQVEIPGSKGFKFGFGATFGLVLIGTIVAAVPFVGAVMNLLGIPLAFVAGALGGALLGHFEKTETDDGAILGAVTGALGNFVASIVGVVIGFVVSVVVGSGLSAMASQGGREAAEGVAGQLAAGVAGAAVVGGIGVVSGTIIALLGGLFGGLVVSAIQN